MEFTLSEETEYDCQELYEEMTKVYKDILENSVELNPDFSKSVDNHFWELF